MENAPESVQKSSIPIAAYVAVVIILIVVVAWLLQSGEAPEPEPMPAQPVTIVEPEPEVVPEPEPIMEPEVEEVVEELPEELPAPEIVATPEPEPLHPELAQSDGWMKTQVSDLVMSSPLVELLVPDNLISNFVVFIDNAARGEIVRNFSPAKEPKGKFQATLIPGPDLTYRLDPKSYERFDGYANLLAGLPLEQSLQLFDTIEPLLKEAYRELGYGDDDFNDKLVQTIDLLLETPVVEGEVILKSPAVVYQFNDPALENLLPLQKLLLRMGPENQKKVQAKLREFKEALTQ